MPTTLELQDDEAALIVNADSSFRFLIGGNAKSGEDLLGPHEQLIYALGVRIMKEPGFIREQLDWFHRLGVETGVVAQLEEHPASNREDGGSSPLDVAKED